MKNNPFNASPSKVEQDFTTALCAFIGLLQQMDNKIEGGTYHYELDANTPKKYFRIVAISHKGQSKSVYCFVGKDFTDKETYGMILKPASYQAAERKNPRGSIFDDNPIKYCGRFGVEYMNEKNAKDRDETRQSKKVRLLKEKVLAKGGYKGHTRELLDSCEDTLGRYGTLKKATMIELNELWKVYTDAVWKVYTDAV